MIARWLFWILLLTSILSCGIRQVELEASKTKVSAKSSRETDIEIKNNLKTNTSVTNMDQSKSVDEDVEIVEEFGDNGNLKKRTYRKSSHQKEQSKKKDSLGTTIDQSSLKIKEREKSKADSLHKEKAKKTSSDKTVATNVGGAGWLYVTVISIAILLLFYFWIRKPVKKEQKKKISLTNENK